MRRKLIFSITLIFTGLVFFVVSSSGNASQPHYQLSEFYQKLGREPGALTKKYMTLYGNVKEGSLQKEGTQAYFVLTKDKNDLDVFFTGKTLLPDTFKEGSQVGIEGIYDQEKKSFIADKAMAKCASRYKSYPKE